jgi:hypothetical protein
MGYFYFNLNRRVALNPKMIQQNLRGWWLNPHRHWEYFSLLLKGPAADAMDAPQPEGLLCDPVRKMMKMGFFCFFHFNGAPVG